MVHQEDVSFLDFGKTFHKPLVEGGFYVMKRVYSSSHDMH